jgi:predicted transposase YdaD
MNHPENQTRIAKSPELSAYGKFVRQVEQYRADGMRLDAAITRVVKECIQQGVLAEYFAKYKEAIFKMLAFEYDEEVALRVQREEALEEGEIKGQIKGEMNEKTATVKRMYNYGLDFALISEATELPKDKILEILHQ